MQVTNNVFGGGPSVDDGVRHVAWVGSIAFRGGFRFDGDGGGREPLSDVGHACDWISAAAQDGREVHWAGVVDDDAGARAKGIDQFVIDETANIGLRDSGGERVFRSCDDLDLVDASKEIHQLRYMRVLSGAPLRSDVDCDEWRSWFGELLLVKTFYVFPGNGSDRGPRPIAVADWTPAFRIGRIEQRRPARSEGEPAG